MTARVLALLMLKFQCCADAPSLSSSRNRAPIPRTREPAGDKSSRFCGGSSALHGGWRHLQCPEIEPPKRLGAAHLGNPRS